MADYTTQDYELKPSSDIRHFPRSRRPVWPSLFRKWRLLATLLLMRRFGILRSVYSTSLEALTSLEKTRLSPFFVEIHPLGPREHSGWRIVESMALLARISRSGSKSCASPSSWPSSQRIDGIWTNLVS